MLDKKRKITRIDILIALHELVRSEFLSVRKRGMTIKHFGDESAYMDLVLSLFNENYLDIR